MISDYYKDLILEVVTKVPDSGGGFTEAIVTSTFQGYLAPLTAFERLANQQVSVLVNAKLFTEEIITVTSRIIDGVDEYEVVGAYNFFHRYYELKKVTDSVTVIDETIVADLDYLLTLDLEIFIESGNELFLIGD